MSLYWFAKVNCGYKPPRLIDTSDPTIITFELMILGGNTCQWEPVGVLTILLPVFLLGYGICLPGFGRWRGHTTPAFVFSKACKGEKK
jgi:hypothetical protein